MPVQKLLANPAVAGWIKECDWLMYQKMIRVVAPLTRQVIPKQVVDFLKAISKKLGHHIKTSFQSHPAHVIEAKLCPATIFASLLDRTLRVNLAAHAAANILCNEANRDKIYEEWVLNVETVKIVQNELPNCGYSEVLHILTTEMRGLLEPLRVPWEMGQNKRSYDDAARPTSSSTEGVLDRWLTFLASLPERFPKADARTIMTCVNGVATAALRDITMNGGKSFGSWWITKLWLDETLAWMAEKGGFMQHSPPEASSMPSFDTDLPFLRENNGNRNRARSGTVSQTETRFSSVDGDLSNNSNPAYQAQNPFETSQQAQQRGTFDQSENRMSQAALAAAAGFGKDAVHSVHDDSGIGMRMGDEDLSMGKFGFGSDQGDNAAVLGDGTGHDVGSSDVVVC